MASRILSPTLSSFQHSDGMFCINLLWPSHPWMEAHGWGRSDANCHTEFQAAEVEGYLRHDESGTRFVSGPSTHFFDSYFPQAHILGNRTQVSSIVTWWDEFTSNITITHYTRATYVHNTTRLDEPVHLQWGEDAVSYSRYAGCYSMTLSWGDPSYVVTQQQDGCILPCSMEQYTLPPFVPFVDCPGRCLVLSVGSASIAAPGLFGTYFSNTTMAHIEKLRAYSSSEYYLPWCSRTVMRGHSVRSHLHNLEGQFISVLLSGINAPPSFDANGTLDDARFHWMGGTTSGIVMNCTMWDSLNVGFANGSEPPWAPPHPTASKTVPAHAFADISTQFWQSVDDWRRGIIGDINELVQSFGTLVPVALLEAAVQSIVADAVRLLQRHASQELATTDYTKSREGAFLDISVTLVAAVAMASGCADIQTCLRALLDVCSCGALPAKWNKTVARAATCAIVCLGLIMAPFFILRSEYAAQDTNTNDGHSSKVGTLAADTGSGTGPYIVVGIVTIRTTTVYDDVALGLEWFNLAFACASAAFICADLLWPGNPWRRRRQGANKIRLKRQLGFKEGMKGLEGVKELEGGDAA